ncbi:CidA/LrgA family protein [Kushneria sp. AK178]
MLKGFMWLMIFLVIGNLLQTTLALPVVGSVLGMLLLFLVLIMRRRSSRSMGVAASHLIHYFTLLILPSAAGLFFLGSPLTDNWLKLLIAVVLGTLISSMVTLATMQAMVRWQQRRDDPADAS